MNNSRLSPSQIKKLVIYWKESTEQNYKAMRSLYQSKRYDACLFFGHLILEKALKILIMEHTKAIAPRIHNLIRLQELAEVQLSEDDLDLLADANEFNMETRYPDAKYAFYKQCTKKYTDVYYSRIIKLYKRLCQEMK